MVCVVIMNRVDHEATESFPSPFSSRNSQRSELICPGVLKGVKTTCVCVCVCICVCMCAHRNHVVDLTVFIVRKLREKYFMAMKKIYATYI